MPVFSKGQASTAKKTTAPDLLRKAPRELFLNTLALVVDNGAAVIIASTRNGDALVLTLLNGDDKEKVYPTTLEELREALTDLAAEFGTGV